MEALNTNTSTSQTRAQVPATSGIGKSGTFWLPPKTSESFSSNLTKKSSSKTNDSKNTRAAVSNIKTQAGSRKPNIQNSLKQAKESHPLNDKSPRQTTAVKNNPSSLTLTTKPKSSVVSNNYNIKASKSSFLPPNTPPASKNPKLLKTFFTPQVLKENINPDGERREGKQKNHSRGTETAKHKTTMETAKLPDESLKLGMSNRDCPSILQESSKSFINLANKSIMPKIAYLTKNDKKVVRFAIDLPGGEKLGVRIEKQGKDFTLCFICPDKSSLSLLDFAKPSITQAANDITQGGLKITVFNSYKEMDLHQGIAA